MRAFLLRLIGCRFDPWSGVDLSNGRFPALWLPQQFANGATLHRLPDGTDYLRPTEAGKLTAAAFISRERCVFA